MSALPKTTLTPAEYLEIERAAEFRSEFFDGEMFAMAGGTENHNLITLNVAGELRAHFRNRPCRTYSENMRVQIDASGRYTYPGVVALCSPPRFADEVRDTLLNPELIVEVLSSSTRRYNLGTKFIRYQSIASLTEYVLIAQEEPAILRYNRQPGGTWIVTFFHGLDSAIELQSVGCVLPLGEIYRNVEFPAAPKSEHPGSL